MRKFVALIALFAAFAAEADVPFRLGIAGYTFQKKTLDETLAIMKKSDVHYLCVKDFHLPLTATDADISAFRDKCAAADVTPYAIGPIYVKDAAKLRQCFEFARRLGVRTVVGVPYEPVGGKDTWATRRGSRKLLLEADRLVKEFDIRYAIHNHGPSAPEMFPDVEYVWNLVGDLDGRIGFCIDVEWEAACGRNPAETIRKYSARIFDAHIRTSAPDKPFGAAVPLPRGKIDLAEVFRAFVESGYTGVCSLEYTKDFTDNLAPVCECIGYERGLCDALSKFCGPVKR